MPMPCGGEKLEGHRPVWLARGRMDGTAGVGKSQIASDLQVRGEVWVFCFLSLLKPLKDPEQRSGMV